MPGRKSNISTASVGPEDGAESTPVRSTKEGTGVEDLSLPKSMIARLAKGVLPANTQIHKDALLALHKSATVFISYIASNSSDNAHSSGKKTISPQDVIAALKDAEFEDFLPRLEAELKKYNDTQCDKRNTYRRKVKEEKAAAAPQDRELEGQKENGGPEGPRAQLNGGSSAVNGHAAQADDERPAKKFKGQDGEAVAPEPDAMDDGDDDAQEDGGEDEDDDVPDDDVDDDVDDDDGQDETMEEPGDEADGMGAPRDEALDDPDNDSD